MTLGEVVVTVAAFIGAILGIWNVIWNWRQTKVKLRVSPAVYIMYDSAGNAFQQPATTINKLSECEEPSEMSIDILNLSNFPVRITEIGFKQSLNKKSRWAIFRNYPERGDSIPKTLEPRQSMSYILQLSDFWGRQETKYITAAYAKTECGAIQFGKSEALKSIIENHA